MEDWASARMRSTALLLYFLQGSFRVVDIRGIATGRNWSNTLLLMSDKDTRVATARREKRFPTIEQVKHVIAAMANDSEIELRNRALVAFTLLTGARDSAIASMKLKHVDLVAGSVYQDAREVNTKFTKTFTTYFFPVGDEIHQIVEDWVNYLRQDKLWDNDDPLFPATHMVLNAAMQFEAAGLKLEHWSSTARIHTIFREAFHAAGLPYFNPHSVRSTLVRLRETVCQTAEEFKAWSQKLATSDVMPIHVNISPHGNKHHRNIIFVDDFIARMIAQPRHQRARFVTDYQVGFNQFRVGFPAWAGLPGV